MTNLMPAPFIPPNQPNQPPAAQVVNGTFLVLQQNGAMLTPEEAGWSVPEMMANPRIIMTLSGLEKQGKDFFAFTAALCGYGPVFLHNFDFGVEGVVDPFLIRGRGHPEAAIYQKVYRRPPNFQILPQADKQDIAKALHDSFRQFWMDSVARRQGTIIIDTHSEEWELRRIAEFGKLTQVMPHQYGIVNQEFNAEIRQAYESGMNIILLQKRKSEYINNNNTGRTTPSGYGDINYSVQAVVQAFRDPNDRHFKIYIEEVRQNMALAGMTVDVHDRWDAFGLFMNMVFGNELAPLQPALGGNGPATLPLPSAPTLALPQVATPPWAVQ